MFKKLFNSFLGRKLPTWEWKDGKKLKLVKIPSTYNLTMMLHRQKWILSSKMLKNHYIG